MCFEVITLVHLYCSFVGGREEDTCRCKYELNCGIKFYYQLTAYCASTFCLGGCLSGKISPFLLPALWIEILFGDFLRPQPMLLQSDSHRGSCVESEWSAKADFALSAVIFRSFELFAWSNFRDVIAVSLFSPPLDTEWSHISCQPLEGQHSTSRQWLSLASLSWKVLLSQKVLNEKLPAAETGSVPQSGAQPFDGDKKIHELFPPLDGVEFELQLVKQSQWNMNMEGRGSEE